MNKCFLFSLRLFESTLMSSWSLKTVGAIEYRLKLAFVLMIFGDFWLFWDWKCQSGCLQVLAIKQSNAESFKVKDLTFRYHNSLPNNNNCLGASCIARAQTQARQLNRSTKFKQLVYSTELGFWNEKHKNAYKMKSLIALLID